MWFPLRLAGPLGFQSQHTPATGLISKRAPPTDAGEVNAFLFFHAKPALLLSAHTWLSASAVTLAGHGCMLCVLHLGDSAAVMVTTIYRASTRAKPCTGPFTSVISFTPDDSHR